MACEIEPVKLNLSGRWLKSVVIHQQMGDGWWRKKETETSLSLSGKHEKKKIIIQCSRGSREADNEVKLMGAGKLLTQGRRDWSVMSCLHFYCVHPFLSAWRLFIPINISSDYHPGLCSSGAEFVCVYNNVNATTVMCWCVLEDSWCVPGKNVLEKQRSMAGWEGWLLRPLLSFILLTAHFYQTFKDSGFI